jgi:hypothetical protein
MKKKIFSKKQLVKEHKLINNLLRKQEKQKNDLIKKCKLSVSLFKNEWCWDKDSFFEEFSRNIKDIIIEYKSRVGTDIK